MPRPREAKRAGIEASGSTGQRFPGEGRGPVATARYWPRPSPRSEMTAARLGRAWRRWGRSTARRWRPTDCPRSCCRRLPVPPCCLRQARRLPCRPGGGRGRGQRLVRALLVQIQDHVGAILRVRQAREGHLGARRELARAGQPGVELVEAPVAALGLERVGEGEAALALGDRFADRAVQVRADAVGAARIDRVARRALLEHFGALGGVGGREQAGDRHFGRRPAVAALGDALDRKPSFLGSPLA